MSRVSVWKLKPGDKSEQSVCFNPRLKPIPEKKNPGFLIPGGKKGLSPGFGVVADTLYT